MSVIPPPNKTNASRAAEIEVNAAMEHIGRYVREFREHGRAMTQQELGEAAGVHRDTVARLESGRFVSVEVLLKVWQALGVLPNVQKLLADQEVLAIQTARTFSRQAREKAAANQPAS